MAKSTAVPSSEYSVEQCLESIFFAGDETQKIVHLTAFLKGESSHKCWVVRLLLEGMVMPKLRLNKLKATLLGRIDSWVWDTSYAFMGDVGESLARLWPSTSIDKHSGSLKGADWNRITTELINANSDEVDLVAAAWLDQLNDLQRWLFIKVFVQRVRFGIGRQSVFQCLKDVSANDESLEPYWHVVRNETRLIDRYLAGGGGLEMVPKGVAFQPIPRLVDYPLQEIVKWDAEDFTRIRCPRGILVYITTNGSEKSIFKDDGELLNSGFHDLLSGLEGEHTIVGLVHDVDGVSGNPMLEKRLLAVKQGKWLKKPEQCPVNLTVFYWRVGNGETPLASKPFVIPERSMVDSWNTEDLDGDSLFLRRTEDLDQQGPLWFRVLPAEESVHAVLLYAEKARSSGFASLTVGLLNESQTWIPIAKLDPSQMAMMDVPRFEDWVKQNIAFKKGPILEFRKNLVLKIAYRGVHAAPRRKCGFELEHVRLERIAWEYRIESLPGLEGFVNSFPHC